MTTTARPAQARRHLSIAVTGHRHTNDALEANLDEVEAVLTNLFDRVAARVGGESDALGPVRLYNLLAEGVDQITARLALDRDWRLVAPLPFGKALYTAINLSPSAISDARAMIEGKDVSDPAMAERVARLREYMESAQCFELAERDAEIAEIFLAALADPDDPAKRRIFEAQSNDRVALAGRVMAERADLLIAVWDGRLANLAGGTGHTAVAALQGGTPVLLVDPVQPEQWRMLTRPEEIANPPEHVPDALETVITSALGLDSQDAATPLESERWHRGSNRIWTLYRGMEKALGGEPNRDDSLVTTYERPDEIAQGSANRTITAMRGLRHVDERQVDGIVSTILPQFAWADGISSWLSDAYRSGMCLNFMLAAFAVIVGAAYLPLGLLEQKWIFAAIELALLGMILGITLIGRRYAWHARWFETRRVAEYLRHGPIMLLLGVFRSTGRWPGAADRAWPEQYARHHLRFAGLPILALDREYLRSVLETLLLPHVKEQRDYHLAKASRLRKVDHRLDHFAELLFSLAIISVSIYLLLKLGAVLGLLPYDWPTSVSMWLTFLGIAFPTLGASIAGIRFFADFERFAAISDVTAGKLDGVAERISLLLGSPERAISYGPVSELAHAVDEIVLEELENWQAVFSAKHIALPA